MKFIQADTLKQKPDFNHLNFGENFTDYMLTMEWEDGVWHEPVIEPFHNFECSPAMLVFHYGQGIFEGCKAYKNEKGEISLFRTKDNLIRMNKSAERMCMPQFDVDVVFEAIKELIKVEKDWIPTEPGTSLYIRPTMIATQPVLGVRVSRTFKFFVILSPVSKYHPAEDGNLPALYVEDHLVRAAVGGTGEAKCLGNYGASFYAFAKAKANGYQDILWLDACEHKYIEEVGTMNVMFVIDGVVVTPAINGSILQGITRNSVLQVLKQFDYKFEERRVSIDEVMQAAKEGRLTECFGVGTAAVISPVGSIAYEGNEYVINNKFIGPVSKFLKDRITGIQSKKYPDDFGWVIDVE